VTDEERQKVLLLKVELAIVQAATVGGRHCIMVTLQGDEALPLKGFLFGALRDAGYTVHLEEQELDSVTLHVVWDPEAHEDEPDYAPAFAGKPYGHA
jgi:hypothetical protein